MNPGLPRTNPTSDKEEGLNLGPPDYKTSTLNHLAMLAPKTSTCHQDALLSCYHKDTVHVTNSLQKTEHVASCQGRDSTDVMHTTYNTSADKNKNSLTKHSS